MAVFAPGKKVSNTYRGVDYEVMMSEGPYGGFIVRFKISGVEKWSGLATKAQTALLAVDAGEQAARLVIDANQRKGGQ